MAAEPPEKGGVQQRVMRLGRRIGIAIAGGAVIVAGVVLLPLPGPGILIIALGLAILSQEFDRPRIWLAYLKARGVQLVQKVSGKSRRQGPH